MDGVKDFYESSPQGLGNLTAVLRVGPLKQLKSMLKRIDGDAFKRTENVSV